METRKAKTRVAAMVVLCVCGLLVYGLIARGGGLEPIAPPGPTMYTLEEIYNLIGSQVQKPKAFDCFLYVGGVDGESTDAAHVGWIELLAYSHGVSQTAGGDRSTGGSATAERCDHKVFTVVKTLDQASPELSLLCCDGDHIDEVRIELCMATGAKFKFMEYKLEDVIISAVNQFTAGAMLTARPLEEVSFNYGRITWTYFGQQGQVEKWWSLVENKGG
jgi:type VI secretion system secreted protein Hcp